MSLYERKISFSEPALAGVFWDVDDFPIPTGYDLVWLPRRIESALQKHDYLFDVSIFSYGEKKWNEVGYPFIVAKVMYGEEEEKRKRLARMLFDMIHFVYANQVCKYYKKLHLIVISKGIPQVFVPVLEDLKKLHGKVKVHLAVPDGCVPEDEVLFNTARLVWDWKTLIAGGSAKEVEPASDSDEATVNNKTEVLKQDKKYMGQTEKKPMMKPTSHQTQVTTKQPSATRGCYEDKKRGLAEEKRRKSATPCTMNKTTSNRFALLGSLTSSLD